MKVLKSANDPDLYCLWNNIGKEVTEAVAYDRIMKSIVDEDDWDPGIFKWVSDNNFNFEEWQEIVVSPITYTHHG